MDHRCVHTLLIALALAALSVTYAHMVHAGGVYKWVDSNGKVHYGDRPPTASKSKSVDVAPPSGANTNALSEAERAERRRQLLHAFEAERVERAKKRAQKRAMAEKRKQRQRECAFAREDLDRLGRAGYIYDYDHTGQRRILSDDEREAYVQKFKDGVSKHCK